MPRHLPYSLKPEFVRGCTMRCVFCALRHQEWAEAHYEFIDPALWAQYVDAVAEWRPKVRVEIANRGEPTLHPEFLDMIRRGREALPKAQFLVTTNTDLCEQIGIPAFRDWVLDAMEAGVNCFLLDCYTPRRYQQIKEQFSDIAGTFFGDDGLPAVNPYPYRGPQWKAISIKDATPKPLPKENVLLHYHNQGGNAVVTGNAAKLYDIPVLEEPLERMCVRPFREMPMWYDGTVPICCDDWADKQILGRFPDLTLAELWAAYDDARRNLIAKDRGAMEPCNRCSEQQGKRFGLELDWFAGDGYTVPTRT